MKLVFRKISILGPGLLGGSLAAALHQKDPGCKIALWTRRAEVVESVRQFSWGRGCTTDLGEAVEETGLVVLATPVPIFIPLLQKLLPHLPTGCLLTDVGSTKSRFFKDLEALAATAAWKERKPVFVGSHPMAGSEETGWASARADLFRQRTCLIIPGPGSDEATLKTVTSFWASLEMRVLPPCTPEEHDERVAWVSHLPHLVAASLANCLGHLPDSAVATSGPGIRDTVRIAGGDAALWRAIVEENRPALRQAVAAFSDSWKTLSDVLNDESRGDALEAFLAAGQVFQKRLVNFDPE